MESEWSGKWKGNSWSGEYAEWSAECAESGEEQWRESGAVECEEWSLESGEESHAQSRRETGAESVEWRVELEWSEL